MIEEVKLRRKYLNSGDVFILDLGLDLIQVGLLPIVPVFSTRRSSDKATITQLL